MVVCGFQWCFEKLLLIHLNETPTLAKNSSVPVSITSTLLMDDVVDVPVTSDELGKRKGWSHEIRNDGFLQRVVLLFTISCSLFFIFQSLSAADVKQPLVLNSSSSDSLALMRGQILKILSTLMLCARSNCVADINIVDGKNKHSGAMLQKRNWQWYAGKQKALRVTISRACLIVCFTCWDANSRQNKFSCEKSNNTVQSKQDSS